MQRLTPWRPRYIITMGKRLTVSERMHILSASVSLWVINHSNINTGSGGLFLSVQSSAMADGIFFLIIYLLLCVLLFLDQFYVIYWQWWPAKVFLWLIFRLSIEPSGKLKLKHTPVEFLRTQSVMTQYFFPASLSNVAKANYVSDRDTLCR